MSTTRETFSLPIVRRGEKEMHLALRLAHAENALQALTSGQVDAIITPDGRAHLVRPAPEQMRPSERRLQAMYESAADVILIVGRGGGVISQNRSATRLLGYEAGSLAGKNLFELVHEEDLPQFYSAFFNVIEGFQEDAVVQFRLRHHAGLYRTLEASVAQFHDGLTAQAVLVCRDISRRGSTFEEVARQLATLAEAAATKDRFLAMLSHELRTPLMPALLGIQELHEDERFVEARPILKMIRRNLQLQMHLLEDLIDFTVIGQHKVRLQTEAVDVHEAVRFALEICRTEIAAARMAVVLDLQASPCMVLASPTRLQQIMWNLIKNAVKFSTVGSSISIVSSKNAVGGVILDFVDHGIGIGAELLPLVFDAFQQGDRLAPHSHGSFGLGLFIARGLAEAQGGTLSAHSEGQGKGTTFRLTLTKAPPRDVIPFTV